MSTLTVALLQMASYGADQPANLAKGESFCRIAASMGADIALFPEMWNIGYTSCPSASSDPAGHAAWDAMAVGPHDPYVTHFRNLAQELDMAIALTYLERWPGAPRNTVSLIDRRGDILMTYAKVHTCDFSTEIACTPGDGFHVCPLDTRAGPVNVGLMICYDREFPESARVLMLQGAELILTPNACELEQHRIRQFTTRAYENMLAVAMTNYAAPQNNGHSVAFDGIAFDSDERSRDMLLVEAGEGEGVYAARIDLDRLRDYRSREIWGNAFRKVSRYALLTSPTTQPPFIRPRARR